MRRAVLVTLARQSRVLRNRAGARSYLWSHATELGIYTNKIKENGVHVPVRRARFQRTVGAVVTMASALASL